MKLLIEFQKLATICFVVFYSLGAYFLLKFMHRDIISFEDNTSIVIAGIFCLGVSLLFFQGILNPAGGHIQTYQKIWIYVISIASCTISFMYLMTALQKLHPNRFSDIAFLLASIIQSIIMVAMMMEYKIRQYQSN